MPASHPPTLLTIVARTLGEGGLFGRGDRVLVAVSGGPDSMALLHVLASLRSRIGHALVAHGVDHGLRPAAAGELDLAAAFARELEVPFDRTRVALEQGGNLQARARDARYAALRTAAARAGAGVIATAHHQADRAETVLLRLLRGAGPRGLAVLPPRAGDLVRPLLHAPRAAIDAHLTRHAIAFAVDPSNGDRRFLRARVRHEVLPLLRELSPAIERHLSALADQLAVTSSRERPAAEPLASVSRASWQAMESLLRTRSPRARVALKRGVVVRWDAEAQGLVLEEMSESPRPRKGPRSHPFSGAQTSGKRK